MLKTSSDIRNESDLWDYAKADPRNLELVRYIAQNISNILEDGYIESRMLSRFPGKLGYCLETLRAQHGETIPTVTQLIEHEDEDSHILKVSCS